MRSKVVLIRGWGDISPKITLGEYERINADYVVLITALRYPSTLPEEFSGFECDPTTMYTEVEKILKHWAQNDQEYNAAVEYATTLTQRRDVKSVEGNSLKIRWWYDTVRNYHRHLGQTVLDAEINGQVFVLEGAEMSFNEAIEKLQPQPFLG